MNRKRNAFTLSEALTVVAILGIGTALFFLGKTSFKESIAKTNRETIEFETPDGLRVEMAPSAIGIRLRIFDSERNSNGNEIYIVAQDIPTETEDIDGEIDTISDVHVPKDHWFRNLPKSEIQGYYDLARKRLAEKNAINDGLIDPNAVDEPNAPAEPNAQ